jgi:hypothetical protein
MNNIKPLWIFIDDMVISPFFLFSTEKITGKTTEKRV